MTIFHCTPPPAPAKDKAVALDTLWTFVASLGFDPNQVIAAYAQQEAFSLGATVGEIQARLRESLAPAEAALFGFNSKL